MGRRAITNGRPENKKLTLEERVARIEKYLGIGRERPAKKPVNKVAYDLAIDAFLLGDSKPLREYRQHYSIPGA